MPDNQQITPEIRVLMQEILTQLAAIYDASNLQKGIYYGAVLGNRGFTIKFERDITLEGPKADESGKAG